LILGPVLWLNFVSHYLMLSRWMPLLIKPLLKEQQIFKR
jgi:hypothetical protein